MNAALSPVLDGSLLGPFSGQMAPAFLREHLVSNVRAGGALSSPRVGNQPYGLLPMASIIRWRVTGEAPDDSKLLSSLRALRKLWTVYSGTVPRVEIGTEMRDLLRQESSSCRYVMTKSGDSSLPAGEPLPIPSLPGPLD